MKDWNNIDAILECKYGRGVDDNEKRFNYIEEDEWEFDFQDTYEHILGHEND